MLIKIIKGFFGIQFLIFGLITSISFISCICTGKIIECIPLLLISIFLLFIGFRLLGIRSFTIFKKSDQSIELKTGDVDCYTSAKAFEEIQEKRNYWRNLPPTEVQISFALDLGIKFDEDSVTRGELSDMISRVTGK